MVVKKSTTRLKHKAAKAKSRDAGVVKGVGKKSKKGKVSNQELAKFLREQRVGGRGSGRPKYVKKKRDGDRKTSGGGGGGGGGAPVADDDDEHANGNARNGDADGVQRRFEDMDADEFLANGSFLAGDDADDDSLEDSGMSGDEEEDESGDESEDDFDDDEGASEDDKGASEDDEDVSDDDIAADNAKKEKKKKEKESASEADASIEKQQLHSSTEKRRRSGSVHKQQLEDLRKSDPEFYKYLEEQDDRLLAFDAGDDDDGEEDEDDFDDEDDEDDDEEGGDDDTEDRGGTTSGGGKGVAVITLAEVEKWREIALSKKPSLAAANNLLRAYRAACHHGDESAVDGSTDARGPNVRLAGADTYNTVMTFCLRNMGALLLKLLGEKPPKLAMSQKFTHGRDPSEADREISAKWRGMESMFRTFVGNSLHLVMSMTDPALLAFTLRGLRSSMKALVPFPALTKKFMRAVLAIFGDSANEEPRTKFEAYLFLRRMAMDVPDMGFERTLNGLYRTFASNAKFVNHASLPRIAFMAGCIADCVGIDQIKAYPIAFQHIRQMAIMLKAALTAKSAETVQTVYSWQFLNCADVWIRVLSAHAADENAPLRPLVYPLVQVLVGVVKLVPTSRYTPLRLRCIKMLISLSRATRVYVPLSPLLLSMLSMTELKSPPTGGAGRQTDWLYTIRLPKSLLRTSTFHEQTVTEITELLTQHTAQFACHIAFPELAYTSTVALKHFASATPVDRFRKQVRALVHVLEQNTVWIMQRRSNVDFAPKDGDQVDAFEEEAMRTKKSPLVKFNAEKMTLRRRREAIVHAQDEDLVLTDAGQGDDPPKKKRAKLLSRKQDEMTSDADGIASNGRGGKKDGRKEHGSNASPSSPFAEVPKRMSEIMRKGAEDASAAPAGEMDDVVGDLVLSDDSDDEDHRDNEVLDFGQHISSMRSRAPNATTTSTDQQQQQKKKKKRKKSSPSKEKLSKADSTRSAPTIKSKKKKKMDT